MKFTTARKITVAAAFVLVVVGLIFNTGSGTLSSFGWQEIAAICPLGVVEGFLANKTIIPRAMIVLGLAVLFMIVFGKVFCAWLCPVPSLKDLVARVGKKRAEKNRKPAGDEQTGSDEGQVTGTSRLVTKDKKSAGKEAYLTTSTEVTDHNQSVGALENAEDPLSSNKELTSEERALIKSSGCSSCAQKRAKFDSRHVVLGGTLLSAAIFGFPVFCLICPIGLTFGTIIIFWQWFGLNDISLSLLIYPAILLIELVIIRKWCFKFCPLGAMLSLMSIPNRFFRPQVNNKKCLRSKGIDCRVCTKVCPEELDPHYADGMNECSKCGLCIEQCPTSAITLPFYSGRSRELSAPQLEQADQGSSNKR